MTSPSDDVTGKLPLNYLQQQSQAGKAKPAEEESGSQAKPVEPKEKRTDQVTVSEQPKSPYVADRSAVTDADMQKYVEMLKAMPGFSEEEEDERIARALGNIEDGIDMSEFSRVLEEEIFGASE